MSIEADPNVDPAGLSACEALARSREFASIRYFSTIDSTNSQALSDLVGDRLPTEPKLYVADSQTAGRGRHGRHWISDPGTLTFSLVVPNAASQPTNRHRESTVPVSIAVGAAIARTIEHLAAPYSARLKWPNDVYLNDRKVAGILVEIGPRRNDGIVIGVGLNVATRFSQTEASIESSAISICELTQRYPHRYQWLGECVEQIFDALDQSLQSPHEIIEEHRRRCVLRGHPIRYSVADRWLLGECEGIDDDGSLIVRTDQVVCRLTSGEVQRVRGLK